MKSKNLLLILITFNIFLLTIRNTFVHLSVWLNINEYSEKNERNAVVLKNSLNAESVGTLNNADKKSDPESSPLVVVNNIFKETQNAKNSIEKVFNY